jgi:DNA-binding transcriptional LysR family regulator
VVESDLANGALVRIDREDVPDPNLIMPMSAVFRTDSPPGPAGRWLIEYLKSSTATHAKPAKAKRTR